MTNLVSIDTKIANTQKIEKMRDTVSSMATIIGEVCLKRLEDIDFEENQIPIHNMPSMLDSLLSMWERIGKIEDAENKRKKDQNVIVTDLSSISTDHLLSMIDINSTDELKEFLSVDIDAFTEDF